VSLSKTSFGWVKLPEWQAAKFSQKNDIKESVEQATRLELEI
jgi:hypothetical protein